MGDRKNMRITGDKVILREIEESDREMLVDLIRTSEGIKMTGGYSVPASYEHQMDWFRSLPQDTGNLRSIIADKERPKDGLGILLLSDMDFRDKTAQIYIKLVKSVRGKGYGKDAVNAMVSYAFDGLGLSCIHSHILEDNHASRRLFEACGFKQEGVQKSRTYKGGHYENVCLYCMKK